MGVRGGSIRMRRCVATLALVLAGCGARADASAAFASSVDIGGRQVYLTCKGPITSDAATVVLISGYRAASDVWTSPEDLDPIKPSSGPPVLDALAETHRVCAYDRPGTAMYAGDAPLTTRTTPVPQPRTARDLVDELDATLRAGRVPKPYVLVGHSLGGLIAQLYARVHPDQVHGIVFIDAFSPTIPSVFGSQWPVYRDAVLNPPVAKRPTAALRSKDSEQLDLDASVKQTVEAPKLPVMPLAVVTKTEPFAGIGSLPGLTAAELNRRYEQAEQALVALAPATPQLFATGSDHAIELSQPDLIVSAIELVLRR